MGKGSAALSEKMSDALSAAAGIKKVRNRVSEPSKRPASSISAADECPGDVRLFVQQGNTAQWQEMLHAAKTSEWRSEDVERRIVDAIRLVERGGRVGPSSRSGFWPPILRGWSDLLAQVEGGTLLDDGNKIRRGATAREVTLAEQALDWPTLYVVRPRDREAFNIWLLAKARRQPWQKLAERAGLSRETAKRRKTRAIGAIAIGLMMDGMPNGEIE